mmetsp:Transcript_12379/g.22370  ORF Transcript_12379/g.22370 Transcript_12379/m.22370 type:complete len:123 (-) Transcript_12379:482-850(-)|eukprot:CAMPEP_0182446738 /NCGR_PEP_ID=MMETSP1172-20130603/5500_1 /TAXON_ID=708627 /ORGANISM="Timspurckia oligopyrenoides, Strain CCMP3278" /LENGTH=122 /DNA_ID=CAMNT_0024642769 /DNA_START=128 /DNA_END=496 /DNA_ORIENTATION=-
MATPMIAGAAVAGAAMIGRAALLAFKQYGASGAATAARTAAGSQLPKVPRAFQGGFEAQMDRKEALLILGLRENATKDQIRDAHRKMMRINHPDAGGSPLLATKVNEAKDLLLARRRGGSIF